MDTNALEPDKQPCLENEKPVTPANPTEDSISESVAPQAEANTHPVQQYAEGSVADDPEGTVQEPMAEAAPTETPDYKTMDTDAMIEEFGRLVGEEPVQAIGRDVRNLKAAFDALIDTQRKEKEAAFLADETNDAADFTFSSPEKERFNRIYNEYKGKREAYQQRLDAQMQANLEERISLIEELKTLIDKEENISIKEFQHIQNRWRASGMIPREQSSAIWQTYHHHVERFFDYLNLNREFRESEFTRNLQAKEAIIERAEALVGEPSVKKAFEELQNLHRLWKEETGPVAPEKREDIWSRFSQATQKVHERRHQFLKGQKEILKKNMEARLAVCDKIAELAATSEHSHDLWQKKITEIEELKKAFRETGAIPIARSNEVWERFKEVTRVFNRAKNEYYREVKKVQLENLAKKNKLVETAESLKESTDWEKTAATLKSIQAQWKTIGHVPRQKSDEIWNKFRAACNHFFDRLSAERKGADKGMEENLEKKQAILTTLESFSTDGNPDEKLSEIKTIIGQWRSLGRVPRNKRAVEDKFNEKIDHLFEKLKFDRRDLAMMRFKDKVNECVEAGDKTKLYGETDFVRRKIDELNREINQLRNNIEFFKTSKAGEENPVVREVHKKITQGEENIGFWKEKLAYIRSVKA